MTARIVNMDGAGRARGQDRRLHEISDQALVVGRRLQHAAASGDPDALEDALHEAWRAIGNLVGDLLRNGPLEVSRRWSA